MVIESSAITVKCRCSEQGLFAVLASSVCNIMLANNANLRYTVYIILYTVSHSYQKSTRCIEALCTYTFYI